MAQKSSLSDKKIGLLNVVSSIIFRMILMITALYARRLLIHYIGNEANGLDSLYNSIIGFLSVAELGVGSAITYCMYKPIIDDDKETVSGLYRLFSKLYLYIALIIFVGGLLIMPFLKILAKDHDSLDVNLYGTFFLMLFSVVLTYLYSSKMSLVNAYKKNYVTTMITSSSTIIQQLVQIVVLILSGSFLGYFVCKFISVIIQWIAIDLYTKKNYMDVITSRGILDNAIKCEIVKNVKAMFMHKIGGVLVNTADSIIISAFIGVVALGGYSNYTIIMTSMITVITLFFTPLTSVIGHLHAESIDKSKKYFGVFHDFNFAIGVIFFLGYYAIIDNVVTLIFGTGLELSKEISAVITINYFVQFMRQSAILYRDATGAFYYDRWKPLFEGLCNVVLSIILVQVLPDSLRIVGVIIATIITNIIICHSIEPYVVFKHSFMSSARGYYVKNYLYISVFCMVLFVLNRLMIDIGNEFVELLANGFISVGLSIAVCVIVLIINKDDRVYLREIIGHK